MITLDPIEKQVNQYVFDLQNLALEHGCKPDELWELEQATLEEKRQLERKYQLTLSNQVLPEQASELFRLIQLKLNLKPLAQSGNELENKPKSNYLVAFHTGRIKN